MEYFSCKNQVYRAFREPRAIARARAHTRLKHLWRAKHRTPSYWFFFLINTFRITILQHIRGQQINFYSHSPTYFFFQTAVRLRTHKYSVMYVLKATSLSRNDWTACHQQKKSTIFIAYEWLVPRYRMMSDFLNEDEWNLVFHLNEWENMEKMGSIIVTNFY